MDSSGKKIQFCHNLVTYFFMNGDVSKIVHIDIMAFGCQTPKWAKSTTTVVHIHYYYFENLARKLQQHSLSLTGREQQEQHSFFILCFKKETVIQVWDYKRVYLYLLCSKSKKIKCDSFMDVTTVFFSFFFRLMQFWNKCGLYSGVTYFPDNKATLKGI